MSKKLNDQISELVASLKNHALTEHDKTIEERAIAARKIGDIGPKATSTLPELHRVLKNVKAQAKRLHSKPKTNYVLDTLVKLSNTEHALNEAIKSIGN